MTDPVRLIPCPSCGQLLRGATARIGQTARCRVCEHSFTWGVGQVKTHSSGFWPSGARRKLLPGAIILSAVIAVLTLGYLFARPNGRADKPGAVASPTISVRELDELDEAARETRITRIPFTPGAPIRVRINGEGPVSLLLDTGADRTMVAPHVLWRLGVSTKGARRTKLKGVTGSDEAYVVWVDSLEVGQAKVGPLSILAYDADLGKAEGLLGQDFLRHFTVTMAEGIVILRPR